MCRTDNSERKGFQANFSEVPDSGILYTLRCQLLFPADNSTDARGFPGRILRGDEFEYWKRAPASLQNGKMWRQGAA